MSATQPAHPGSPIVPGTDLDLPAFLRAATERVLTGTAGWEDGAMPHYAEKSAWVRVDIAARSQWHGDYYDHGNWTSGFWAGQLLELEELGAPGLHATAEGIADAVRVRAEDDGTHDIGFLFHPSACALADLTGEQRRRDDALRAAEVLLSRLRSPGGYLQAFGRLDDPRSRGTSTIDTMMNLPLLWWAAERTGRPEFREAAISHADATLRTIVRPDASTYHLVRYGEDGVPTWRGTYQGGDDASCWTRGQGWAIHGFVSAHLATGLPRYADAAARTLDFLWSHLDPGELTPNDLDRDGSAADSSAGAIVASALAESLADPALAERLKADARLGRLLETLGRKALFSDRVGLLGHAAYSVPHGLGVDGPLPYGDYYYLRAVRLRLRHG
ncbi:glycoside hydrolase family 88 protein [Streptomyces sp. DW26H14]|uniref:glycoside hydrolase family 88 protein n=1 Tax=Streptomyces sp. DW26H14 TaxID=3435395 RepID=UPI00403DE4FA